jgi:O-antigen/teichoic acid export membrane protein
MRHLYQRNLDFKRYFLSDLGLTLQNLILIVLLISAGLYLRRVIKKDRRLIKRIEAILFTIFIVIMLGVINLAFFKDLLVYGHLIIGFYLVILIQSTNIKILAKAQEE